MYYARIVLRNAEGQERADYALIVEEKEDINKDGLRIWMTDFMEETVDRQLNGMRLGDTVSVEEVDITAYPSLPTSTGQTIREHGMDQIVVLAKDADGLWHRSYWSSLGNFPSEIFWSQYGWENPDDAIYNRKKFGQMVEQRYVVAR